MACPANNVQEYVKIYIINKILFVRKPRASAEGERKPEGETEGKEKKEKRGEKKAISKVKF